MAFRLIKNKTQSIAVKGFVATAIVCALVAFFQPWTIQVTSPFLLGWIMVWIIGASSNTNSSS
jgi:hypothetical protein